jgi:Protein of unknown function (DUF4199)
VRKILLIFGLLSGVVSAGVLIATIPYVNSVNYRRGDILAYTSIALSALLVFLGVRSYRENSNDGGLSFGRGLAVGVLITLISSACHVITFQVLYFKVFPNLGDKYTACMIQRAKDSGASDQKVRQTAELAEKLKRLYDKPATNAAVAFAEAFPVGAFAALLSATILRRKEISSEN